MNSEVLQQTKISIYPNPTQGIISIENLNGSEDVIIQVQDITGMKLKEFTASDAKTELDMNSFANGIYIIHIQSEHSVYTCKLIKN